MAKITKIDVSKPLIKPKLKVAAYARVSVDTDRLRHSLSTQISYYNQFIQSNPEWEFVGVYADLGITGTSVEKREEFKKMMDDCEQGKIDLILTKSIQRFARNTVDLLEVVRHLKQLGIEVRFEKENIHSLSGDGELMLSILASFAQEESRSISENIKWGIRKRFEKGMHNGRFQIYGYRWKDQELIVEPKEAEIVKLIYENYLNGISAETTAKQLAEKGIKGLRGDLLGNSAIRAILKNITYTGNLLLQKEYIVDPIAGKSKLNNGELPQYFVENHHEAIISMDMWQAVQDERERRRKLGVFANKTIPTNALTSKIKCRYCGRNFQRSSRKTSNGRMKYWQCATRKSGKGNPCGTSEIREDILYELFKEIFHCEITQDVLKENIDSIEVYDGKYLDIHLTDGQVIQREYISNKKKDCWTQELRERTSRDRRNKHKRKLKNRATPFTGLLECGCCGKNYVASKSTFWNGTSNYLLFCKTNRELCPNTSTIRDYKLKEIVSEVLNLEIFDEDKMDEVVEKIYIQDYQVTILFKDGHTETVPYQKAKKVTKPWTKERYKIMKKVHKTYWTDEMRKAASDRMKKIRSEKKW